MKRYGIWEITLVTVSGKVDICEITARSGKDARSRAEAGYEGCQILKMTRKTWLDRFSYAQLSAALMNCVPDYADSLLTILADNGVFGCQDEDPSAALMNCVPDYADSLLTILADNGVFGCQDEDPFDVD